MCVFRMVCSLGVPQFVVQSVLCVFSGQCAPWVFPHDVVQSVLCAFSGRCAPCALPHGVRRKAKNKTKKQLPGPSAPLPAPFARLHHYSICLRHLHSSLPHNGGVFRSIGNLLIFPQTWLARWGSYLCCEEVHLSAAPRGVPPQTLGT